MEKDGLETRLSGWACAILSLVVGALSGTAGATLCALTPAESEVSGWKERHAEKLAEIAVNSNREYGVVFIGDSALHQWETRDKYNWRYWFSNGGKLRALNLGFEGDGTENVLWRIGNGELDGVRARLVVIHIGGDCANRHSFMDLPPSDVVLGLKAVLDAVQKKLPKAKIVLHAILPFGKDVEDPIRRRGIVVNREIVKFCNGHGIVWFDPSQRFLTPDGRLPRRLVSPDYLEFSQEGHDIWGGVLVQLLHELLGASHGPYPKTQNTYVSDLGCLDLPRQAIGSANVMSAVKKREDGPFGDYWWLNRLHNRREQVVALKGKKVDVAFLGDSITHFWERFHPQSWSDFTKKYSAINCGYGGDTTQALLWRAQNGELEGYEAKVVVLLIGTNNSYGLEPPEDIAEGVRQCLLTIRAKQPRAKILLHAIFPRGNPDEKSKVAHENPRANNEKVNEIIRGFSDGKDILWCDFNDKWTPDGWGVPKELMPDGIHPSDEGYKIWRAALEPILDKFCK